MFFWFRTDSHRHQLVKIDRKNIKRYTIHSENSAGYDVLETTSDVQVCLICKEEFSYNESMKQKVDFIPYMKRG